MRFLYRHPPSTRFYCTHNEAITYDLACGHCGYPIHRADTKCPRCGIEMQECPVCSRVRCTKGPLDERHSPPPRARRCRLCSVSLLTLDDSAQLDEMKGGFCTNLYGCPAGGMLVHTGEVAIFPADIRLCPVCRSAEFRMLDVRTFRFHTAQCLFCLNVFKAVFGSRIPWLHAGEEEHGGLLDARRNSNESCVLCGRSDAHEDRHIAATGATKGRPPQPPTDQEYSRMLELAAALIFNQSDEAACEELFLKWHPLWLADETEQPQHVTVGRLLQCLWEGTFDERVALALRPRIDGFQASWTAKLPRYGLNFKVSLPERYEPASVHERQ